MTLGRTERQRAKTETQILIDKASRDLERGIVDEAAWSRRVAEALASAYLLDDDPRWQSGFDGDARLWRDARELILAPIHRDGTFLDIGCATGHLMECVQAWALDAGRRLTVYGLELSSALVATARRRLPALASHIFEGNVLDWVPGMRFTFVHTGLEYVPTARQSWLVRRLLDQVVEPGGRLIAGPVTQDDLASAMKAFRDAGTNPAPAEGTDRDGKTRYVVWCDKRGS